MQAWAAPLVNTPFPINKADDCIHQPSATYGRQQQCEPTGVYYLQLGGLCAAKATERAR